MVGNKYKYVINKYLEIRNISQDSKNILRENFILLLNLNLLIFFQGFTSWNHNVFFL